MTITIQDALSMLKSGDASVLAIDQCDERRKISVKRSTEFHNFLIRTLEEHERVMKDAARCQALRHVAGLRDAEAIPYFKILAEHFDGIESMPAAAFNAGADAVYAQITKEQA